MNEVTSVVLSDMNETRYMSCLWSRNEIGFYLLFAEYEWGWLCVLYESSGKCGQEVLFVILLDNSTKIPPIIKNISMIVHNLISFFILVNNDVKYIVFLYLNVYS